MVCKVVGRKPKWVKIQNYNVAYKIGRKFSILLNVQNNCQQNIFGFFDLLEIIYCKR